MWWRRMLSRLQPRILRRAQDESQLDEEIRFHISEEARLNEDAGMPPDKAWNSARHDFGNVVTVKEVTRDIWGWTSLERISQDARYAWRMLLKNPASSLLAVIALALGIGANTAIFTVVNSVLLRALPFSAPDRLVMVWERPPKGKRTNVVQTQNFLDWRARNRSFEEIAAMHQIPVNLAGDGDPVQVQGLRVTSGFFGILGVPPLIGRPILPGEDAPGGRPVVVLSYELWQSRYAGSRAVLGKTVSVFGTSAEIVGVMPPQFSFPNLRAQLYVPLQINPAAAPRDGRNYRTVARLRPGATLQTAQSDMERIAAQTAQERPEMNAQWGATVVPLTEEATGEVRTPLLVLLAAVGFVLLIACVNVANLLLMRASVRAREFTVRLALGANRWRLAHQLIVESVLLAVLAGIAGFGLATWGLHAILSLLPRDFPLPRRAEISIDASVLLFTLAVSVGTGLFFGVLPAFHTHRFGLVEGLHQGGRAASFGRSSLRSALTVAQVAIALVLLIGATLMIRSFVALRSVDPGFNAERVLTMQMLLSPLKYGNQQRRVAVVDEMLHRIRALPGVSAAGSVHLLPLTGNNSGTGYYSLDKPKPQPGEMSGGLVSVISPGYLAAMGIPILQGRDFSERDRTGSLSVAMINQAAALRFYPGEDPIGKHLNIDWTGNPDIEIVGVAGDTRGELNAEPAPCVFLPHAQKPNLWLSLVIRTQGDPLALARAAREQLQAVDRDQGVSELASMQTVLSDSIARPRLQTMLLGMFALLALVLSCIGIYSVFSYSVAQRTREMGVRLALGAPPRSILGMVVGEGIRLAVTGVLIGTIAALALTRYLASLLYAVEPTDALVFFAVAGFLFSVALVACYLPARRATRVDPVIVLRED